MKVYIGKKTQAHTPQRESLDVKVHRKYAGQTMRRRKYTVTVLDKYTQLDIVKLKKKEDEKHTVGSTQV